MSFLHLFNSLARSLNCSGVRISRSPAFLIEASSPLYPSFYFNLADANYEPSDLGLFPKSRFSNLSIVGFSKPLADISSLQPARRTWKHQLP